MKRRFLVSAPTSIIVMWKHAQGHWRQSGPYDRKYSIKKSLCNELDISNIFSYRFLKDSKG